MPHVTIRIAAGRSEHRKREIADAVAEAILRTAGCDDAELSVDVRDVERERWFEDVYGPEVEPRLDAMQRRPGYGRP